MYSELNFVPNILICSDKMEFVSKISTRSFNIVGQVQFSGKIDVGGGQETFDFVKDGKVLLNGELQDVKVLDELLRGDEVHFIIIDTLGELKRYKKLASEINLYNAAFMTLEYFKSFPRGFFYDLGSGIKILQFLKKFAVRTLLDVDAYFAQGKLFTNQDNDNFTQIDCVTEKTLPPIAENMYAHAYKSLEDVGFKHYDAVLIADRSPQGLKEMVALTENFSDKVITFARRGSELEKYLGTNPEDFSKIEPANTWIGKWYFLTRRKPPEDFAMYVVTHKVVPHENKLPAGYTIIQSGRAVHDDLGYQGDDTGDNISHLNPYLNEFCPMYWMWKNTSHTVIGLCHYRRFFTESADKTFNYDKILTEDAALNILKSYDIIISFYTGNIQKDLITRDSGKELFDLGEAVIKKYLLRLHPDYVDAFDQVMSAPVFCLCNIFVSRRNIFDAYCKWLYSFLIDATEEVLRTAHLETLPWGQCRVMAYFAERLRQVWLIKNRCRIKHLNFMMVRGI